MKTTCPTCGASMEIGDSASAWGVCPGCRAVVRASSVDSDMQNWKTTSGAIKAQFGILVIVLLVAATTVILEPRPGGVSVLLCLLSMVAFGYFLSLCLCGSAPDSAARHSVFACVLTLVLGSIGLFLGAMSLSGPVPWGMSPNLVITTLGAGLFAVYFATLVFLMRFHAAVGRAFGNRSLLRQAYVFLGVLFVIAANVALETRLFFIRRQVLLDIWWDHLIPWTGARSTSASSSGMRSSSGDVPDDRSRTRGSRWTSSRTGDDDRGDE